MAALSPRQQLEKLFEQSDPHASSQQAVPLPQHFPRSSYSTKQNHIRRAPSRIALRHIFQTQGVKQQGLNFLHVCMCRIAHTEWFAAPQKPSGPRPSPNVDYHTDSRNDQSHNAGNTNVDAAALGKLEQNRLSMDLQDLTLSDEAGKQPYCGDVADRNMSMSRPTPCTISGALFQLGANHNPTSLTALPLGQPIQASPTKSRAKPLCIPPKGVGRPCYPRDERRRSLSRKPDVFDLRNASEVGNFQDSGLSPRRLQAASDGAQRGSIKRSRLDEPLPATPGDRHSSTLTSTPQLHFDHVVGSPRITEATTSYYKWSAAVTHETITRRVHEIHQESIYKEVHKYHIYHRVQPIIDYDILPPRHFMAVEDGYVEVSEDHLPAETPDAQWITEEVERTFLPAVIDDESNNASTNLLYQLRYDNTEDGELSA